MNLCKEFKPLIADGIASIADTMKVLLFKEHPEVFEKIEFSNDRARKRLLAVFEISKSIGYLVTTIRNMAV